MMKNNFLHKITKGNIGLYSAWK